MIGRCGDRIWYAETFTRYAGSVMWSFFGMMFVFYVLCLIIGGLRWFTEKIEADERAWRNDHR